MNELSAPNFTAASLRQLFAYPFRVFFLSAALLALLVVPTWLLQLTAGLQLPLALPPLLWHQHEMLFGFLHAAIAGFLLTAVCSWTESVRLHDGRLLALWSVWLGGRLLMLTGENLPGWLVHGVDLAFLPLVMLDAGLRIWRVRQLRQLVLMLVLGLLWAMELGFHFGTPARFAQGALLMAMTLMLIIGGRITPAFSGNWLRVHGRDPGQIRVWPPLEALTIGSMLLLLALLLFKAPAGLSATLALVAATASGLRLVLWRGWLVRAEPLLWVLHLALACIPLALLLLAGSLLDRVAPSAWVHAAALGAMGALILGVMCRVALGHTGRAIRLPPGMVWAFVALLAAAAVRVLTALQALPWAAGLSLSAALWSLAFFLFLLRYWRILAAPRMDGRPG